VLVSTHYMDEAERCHQIAYIANGRLLASGTIPEIIASAHLSTWVVTGEGLDPLSSDLKREPGVDMVARFGSALHVGGRDEAAMARVAHRYGAAGAQLWTRDEPTLEDVFIDLMTRAEADQ